MELFECASYTHNAQFRDLVGGRARYVVLETFDVDVSSILCLGIS